MPQTSILVYRQGPGKQAPLIEWLEGLKKTERKAYTKCLAFIQHLEREGFQLQRPTAAPLGDDIYELRPTLGTINYRILYFFCGKNIACLSHGITKEDKVPDVEISRAIRRMNLVKSDIEKYTQEWRVPE
jgi:hypothetical protein